MPELTRMPGDDMPPAMFVRPRDPSDHRQFEELLPQCLPLLVYADENGRDWVRWSMPKDLAARLGWDRGCACCGNTEEVTAANRHSFVFDTAWDEVDWFFGRVDA